MMSLRPFRSLAAASLPMVLVASCMLDWDKLDPSEGAGGQGNSSGVCEPGATTSCYGGPAGTEGVGICVAGETTCQADGSGYGPCLGEVVPRDEDCSEPTDEDCDGTSNEIEAGCGCTPTELIHCYEGPAETEDVGICHGGQQMCLTEDGERTSCFGQVMPLIEECASAADDDCDGTSNEGCPLWGLRFGAPEDHDHLVGIAVLGDGTSVLAGDAVDTMNLGGNALAPNGATDVILGRLDPAGAHLWSARYGDGGDSVAADVAVDGAGDIYVVGSFDGTLDFGGLASPLVAAGTVDGFIAKISAAGVAQWALSLGDSGTTYPRHIAVDPSGNAAVTGYFDGTVTLTSQATSTDSDGFVARLDATGAITWGTTFGAAGIDRGAGVALEGSNILVAGYFTSSVDLGGSATTAGDGLDGFVAKLDGSNVQQWIVPIGSTGDQWAVDVAVDGTDVVVFGDGNGTISVDGGASPAEGEDVFVVKLDGSGTVLWTRHFVGSGDQTVGSMALDGQGNIWFGVMHEGIADYGGGAVLSAGQDDWVLVELEPTAGDHLRSLRFGDKDDQDIRILATDGQGNLVVGGDCQGYVDFGFGALPGSGTYDDMCIARLPP